MKMYRVIGRPQDPVIVIRLAIGGTAEEVKCGQAVAGEDKIAMATY